MASPLSANPPIVFLATVLILWRYNPVAFVHGRLTEFNTERVPVLAHKLHTANVDLRYLRERAQLGPRSGLRMKHGDIFKTRKGGKRVRLVQTYAKYEVYGPTIAAELDMNGYYTGQMFGHVARNLHKDIPNPEACTRDLKAMINRVINLEKLRYDQHNIDERDGRRIILADPSKTKAKIVYVVEFFYTGRGFVSNPQYYIDACSNTILYHYDKAKNFTIPQDHHPKTKVKNPEQIKESIFSKNLRFQTERKNNLNASIGCFSVVNGVGGNENSGKFYYNVPPLCLPVEESGGTCTMESDNIKVVDNENTEDRDRTTPVSFDCTSGYSDEVNGGFGPANDAFYFGHITAEFFDFHYGIKPWTSKPTIIVHYGNEYANTIITDRRIYFGDGDSSLYPLVTPDIVYHELAHIFTDRHSGLSYQFQMGGIQEAFSDMTAFAARKGFRDLEDYWTIGGNLYKSGTKALRYMDDPPKDGKSIKSVWRYHPFLQRYYSCGVFNYAFYKLITAEDVDVYDGYEDFMVANKDIWGKFTGFWRGACGVVQASYDNGHDFDKVIRAFRYTGIRLPFCRENALKATVYPGETRKNIMVKKDRSPIFEIDMRKYRGAFVTAKTEQDSTPVQILVAADYRAKKILARGEGVVGLPGNHTVVHIQLKTDHFKDIQVTIKVVKDKKRLRVEA